MSENLWESGEWGVVEPTELVEEEVVPEEPKDTEPAPDKVERPTEPPSLNFPGRSVGQFATKKGYSGWD